MTGLWKNQDGTREGKYLVQRRDGSIPEWPYFVIAAADHCAPAALRAYAQAASQLGWDPDYVRDVLALANDFEEWRGEHGGGDSDAPPHRTDNPAIIELMQYAQGS